MEADGHGADQHRAARSGARMGSEEEKSVRPSHWGKLNVPVLSGLLSPDQYTSVGDQSTRVHCDQSPLWMGTRTAVDGQFVRSDRSCDLGGTTERRLCRSLGWPGESVQDISPRLCRFDWWPTSVRLHLLPLASARIRRSRPQGMPPASLSAPSDNHPAA